MQTHPKNYPTNLTDEEWEQIKSLVPKPKSGQGKKGRPALDRRVLVNAILYVVRSGCAWRLLPGDFGLNGVKAHVIAVQNAMPEQFFGTSEHQS